MTPTTITAVMINAVAENTLASLVVL